MPRKGEKCITLSEEEYNKIGVIAKKKKTSRKAVVLDSLGTRHPIEFPAEKYQIA
jgi:hypothetical protein